MIQTKRTYKLAPDVLAEFEKQVAPGKRSGVVSEALRTWLDEKKREQLRARILEGLREQRELDEEIEREWAPLSDEVWAQLPDEEWPEPIEVYPNGMEDNRAP
jgi:Arc/MetJ-type ribon-helix-helix transcriptional regulator